MLGLEMDEDMLQEEQAIFDAVEGGTPIPNTAEAPIPNTTESNNLKKRKAPFQWTVVKDLALLKEISSSKPFDGLTQLVRAQNWSKVADVLNILFTSNLDRIGVSRRFALLITDFKKKDNLDRYKSGREEEISEVTDLLGNLHPLYEAALEKSNVENLVKQKKLDEEARKGQEIRTAAMTTVLKRKAGEDSGQSSQVKNRRSSWNNELLVVWQDKEKNARKQQEDELHFKKSESELMNKQREEDRALEYRKLEVQEKLIALQKQQLEFQQQQQMKDSEERKLLMQLLIKQVKKD